jgi:uncharacterized protein
MARPMLRVSRPPRSSWRAAFAGAAAMVLLLTTAAAAGPSDVADAAMRQDVAAVRTLLQQKADVNAAQVDGARAIHWAVYHDDAALADVLIKAGADVKTPNRTGATPLSMAALFGSTAMVDRLLKAGADAKERGANGETMVMYAARSGNPAVIKLLVAAGADVNLRERLRGTTALMWAAEQRHPQAVRALLEFGADFAAKSGPAGLPRNYMANRVNATTVQLAQDRYRRAISAGRTYEEQLALDQREGRSGAQLGPVPGGVVGLGQAAQATPAQQPQTPPAPASPATTPSPTAAAGANRDQGAGPAAGQGAGAARQGGARGQGAAPAADADADADDPDDDEIIVAGLVGTGGGGLTPLVFAAREGDIESARMLLDAGANVDQTTEYGWTPLLVATNNRHYRLGAFLMERGANVTLANKGGWTPLYLATDNRNIEGGDYPVPKADMDHLEYIKLLLDKKADPNARVKDNTLTRTIFTMQWFFEDGATPFVRAAQSSDVALMKLLLQYGADPKLASAYEDTALTAAAGIGWVEGVTYERSAKENVEAIRLLLDLGLDPNAANRDGRTPLMGAALKGRVEVIQLLVERGAKLDQRDRGSRDTDKVGSLLAGHTWQAVDYADGLVRTGVQSAVQRPEAGKLIRKLMADRGMPVPPENRVVDSICVVELCMERAPSQQ